MKIKMLALCETAPEFIEEVGRHNEDAAGRLKEVFASFKGESREFEDIMRLLPDGVGASVFYPPGCHKIRNAVVCACFESPNSLAILKLGSAGIVERTGRCKSTTDH